jgi:hypothetical protein
MVDGLAAVPGGRRGERWLTSLRGPHFNTFVLHTCSRNFWHYTIIHKHGEPLLVNGISAAPSMKINLLVRGCAAGREKLQTNIATNGV